MQAADAEAATYFEIKCERERASAQRAIRRDAQVTKRSADHLTPHPSDSGPLNKCMRYTLLGSRMQKCISEPTDSDEITSAKGPGEIALIVRLIPGILRSIPVVIRQGERWADVSLTRASVSFPEPWGSDGHIDEECLSWIVEAMRNASTTYQLSMCLVGAAAESIYVWPDRRTRRSLLTPSGYCV